MIPSIYLLIVLKLLVGGVETIDFEHLEEESCNKSFSQALNHKNRNLCPPWYVLDNGKCKKQSLLHGVVNYDKSGQTYLHTFSCMTTSFRGDTNRTDIVGGCFYSIELKLLLTNNYPLPCNISKLNDFMCYGLNKEGQLCGRCQEEHAPPVYSYSSSCVKCTEYHMNWLKYIAVGFGPLTVFCLVICIFHISATSPYLHGYIFLCQISTMPLVMRIVQNGALLNPDFNTNATIFTTKIFLSIMEFWNLNFFTLVYDPFCLHPRMTVVQGLTLQYLTAIYPLLLILTAVVLTTLYGRNVKLIVMIWKPLRSILRPVQSNLNIKASLVQSFATLYLLSAMKIQSITFDLLLYTKAYYPSGEKGGRFFYWAGDVEYFGNEHFVYGLLAVFFLVAFVLIPTLLLFLYPCRWFQRFLSKIKCNSLALKIFMDVFQGHYKDGTNNTRDLRFFSGIFFIVRFALAGNFTLLNANYSFMFFGTAITLLGFSVAIVHPQRLRIHYLLDCFAFLIISLGMFAIIGRTLQKGTFFSGIYSSIVKFITVSLLFFYVVGIMVYWVIFVKNFPQKIATHLKKYCVAVQTVECSPLLNT